MQNETNRVMFDRKFLVQLVGPLVIEQILQVTVGMADMIMVSGAGECAVSGVSLVNTISNLLIYLFSAMAAGGAVVGAQALGSKNKKLAYSVANQLMTVCGIIAVVIAAISVVSNHFVLHLIYGSVDKRVMDNAVIYYYITAFSFPFLSLYNGCAALFRAMGNSKISMMTTFLMNGINIVGNAVLVYGVHMGVAGVGTATLVSRIVACIIAMFLLRNEKYPMHIDQHFRFGFDWKIIKKILHIGVPNGIENSIFQIGKLFTQSLISSFGTASIAANATASTIELLATIPASSIALALTTVVGQCVGANNYAEARKYTKKLMAGGYIQLMLLNMLIIVIAPWIASLYNLTAEGNHLAIQLIRYHSCCCMLIWPLSFTLPSTLRAAGDVRFTMCSSIISMWIFRIGLAYLIGGYLHGGVLGVWIAMTIDWAVRSLLNVVRFHGHRWEHESLVKDAA
ncbi:putative inner membrane protein [Lachnospiraceae bacterium KM106-2]|nr:putative inner membrane protein [Lachnospiraceae bacterium KM106-2]